MPSPDERAVDENGEEARVVPILMRKHIAEGIHDLAEESGLPVETLAGAAVARFLHDVKTQNLLPELRERARRYREIGWM